MTGYEFDRLPEHDPILDDCERTAEAISRLWQDPLKTEEDWSEAVDDARPALDSLLAQIQRVRDLAKNARACAAAPDYDEESIRDALWAVVDSALSEGEG